MRFPPIRNPIARDCICVLAGLLWLAGPAAAATNDAVLRLKNGDRLSGRLVSSETNHVVIATSWNESLTVPMAAIEGMETSVTNVAVTPPPAAPVTNAPAPATPPPAAPPPPPVAAVPVKHWKANVQFGNDLVYGAVDRLLFFGRFSWNYDLPYRSDPKKFFRTLADYSAEYGETESVRSANRMTGSLKTDFDFGARNYFYNIVTGGYDEIRKIDLFYEAGPGLGRHLFIGPAFVMNLEGGVNYQMYERSKGGDLDSAYARAAEDVTWKITDRLTFTEKFEFTANLEDASQFRFRLDANLSYLLWKNISLNLTLLDLYDTEPAPGVDNNELQLRSSVGVAF